MNEKRNTGVGIFTILCAVCLLLAVLKVKQIIFWSWVWIFAPLWIPFCLYLLFLILFLYAVVIIAVLGQHMKDE